MLLEPPAENAGICLTAGLLLYPTMSLVLTMSSDSNSSTACSESTLSSYSADWSLPEVQGDYSVLANLSSALDHVLQGMKRYATEWALRYWRLWASFRKESRVDSYEARHCVSSKLSVPHLAGPRRACCNQCCAAGRMACPAHRARQIRVTRGITACREEADFPAEGESGVIRLVSMSTARIR